MLELDVYALPCHQQRLAPLPVPVDRPCPQFSPGAAGMLVGFCTSGTDAVLVLHLLLRNFCCQFLDLPLLRGAHALRDYNATSSKKLSLWHAFSRLKTKPQNRGSNVLWYRAQPDHGHVAISGSDNSDDPMSY